MQIPRYLLLIGAMKAGTTALYELLAGHPEIAPSREKEPNFLSERGGVANDVERYESLWDFDPGRHRWAMEGSTAYTKLGQCPSAAFPSASMPAEFRFVMMVRDPVARIRSEYQHCLAAGWRKNGLDRGIQPASTLMSNYHFQLMPYLAAHSPERILVLSYPEFRADPAGVGRRVTRFLGLPDAPLSNPGAVNTGAGFRSALTVRLLQHRGLIDPGQNPLDYCQVPLDPLGELLTPALAQAGHPHAFEDVQAEIEAKITPSQAQIEQLHRQLDGDLEQFRARWGIDPWIQDTAWLSSNGRVAHEAQSQAGIAPRPVPA